jgi:hypothetical protein
VSGWELSFSERHFYGTGAGIMVPIVLHTRPAAQVQLRAKLDTGSDLCVFQPFYARFLGLELTSGIRQVIGTSTGDFVAYGHEVAVTVLNLEWQATVYFAEPDSFPVNVVGQSGFLNHIRLGLVEHEQFLYLADYNS